MNKYIVCVILFLCVGMSASAKEKSAVGAVIQDLEYAKELKAEGAILTDKAFRDFVSKGPDAELISSSFQELNQAPLSKPNYLILRFNHPRKQHLSGEALVTFNIGMGKPLAFPVELHIGDYWRTYYIPLDSLAWPPFKKDEVKVSIKWSRLTLQ